MNRKRKAMGALLLTAAVVLLLIICVISAGEGTAAETGNVFLGSMTVIRQEEWDALLAENSSGEMDRDGISFNGGRIAYVATENTFYIPQDMESCDWSGTLALTSPSGGELLILQDDYLSDKQTALAEGHAFSCMMVQGQTLRPFSIVFTGLPTVSIEYDSDEPLTENKENHSGKIYVQDTDGSCEVSAISFHVRGATSAYLGKKSYKVTLKTANGENNDLSLCGMRSDDDWILNGLYTDSSRIREALSYRVWEEMISLSGGAEQTIDMVYVEVFLNDHYNGLYLLMERVDGKTFDQDDEDLLYKILYWPEQTDEIWSSGLTQFNGSDTVYGAKIQSPGEREGWNWDVLDSCYRFVMGRITWEELQQAGICPDTDNIMLYDLFVLLTGAQDNQWKNLYLSCIRQEDERWSVTQSPWDLDQTWGDDYGGSFDMSSASHTEAEHSYLWLSYVRDCPDGMSAGNTLWQSLTDAGLSAQRICRIAAQLDTTLRAGGALERESAQYPGTVDTEEFGSITAWIETRCEVMDDIVAAAAQEEEADA